MKNQSVDDVIISCLGWLSSVIKIANKSNLQDRNIYSEEFIGELLNLIWDCKLKDLNVHESQNIDGIDLGDKNTGRCVQVSATTTAKKIQDSINHFETNHLGGDYKELSVVLLVDEKPKFKAKFKLKNGHSFSASDNVLSLAEVHNEIKKLPIKKRTEIASFLDDWFNIDQSLRTTAEIAALKKFFYTVSELADDIEGDGEPIDSDDLQIKKDRFKEFWDHVSEVYQSVMDKKSEAAFFNVSGSLPQSERDKIRKYLRYKSVLLASSTKDPVQVIEKLKTEIMTETKIMFMSETQIVNFLYYHFFRCNVLPNPVMEIVA